MGLDPATTLHDVRWGEEYDGRFVWVYEISGSVPPSHLESGYAGRSAWRQNPMYFPAGGSTIRGVAKPGPIVWSRLYIAGGRLHLDIGRGDAVRLPDEETERRWSLTNPEWPIMHVVLHGVSRDQFMARHKANHIQVAYAPERGHRRPGPRGQGGGLRRAGRHRPPVRRCNPRHVLTAAAARSTRRRHRACRHAAGTPSTSYCGIGGLDAPARRSSAAS